MFFATVCAHLASIGRGVGWSDEGNANGVWTVKSSPTPLRQRLRAQWPAKANQLFINGSAHGNYLDGSGFDLRLSKLTNLDQ
jgi:hypothetical protein